MDSSSRGLSNVPEEESFSKRKDIPRTPSSPYLSPTAANSTSTVPMSSSVGAGSGKTRKPASIRTLGKSSNDQLTTAAGSSTSVKRTTSASSNNAAAQGATLPAGSGGSSGNSVQKSLKTSSSNPHVASGGSTHPQKYRVNPRLPHDKDAEPAP